MIRWRASAPSGRRVPRPPALHAAREQRVAEAVLASRDSGSGLHHRALACRLVRARRGARDRPGAAVRLVALAADASPEVRREAAWALGRQRANGPEVTAALAHALDDGAPAVRAEAARALGAAGADAAADARLIARLDDPRPEVRWAAAAALDAAASTARATCPGSCGPCVTPIPTCAVRGLDARRRRAGGGGGRPRAAGRVARSEPGVRALAVRALGNFGRSDASVVAALADVVATAPARDAGARCGAGQARALGGARGRRDGRGPRGSGRRRSGGRPPSRWIGWARRPARRCRRWSWPKHDAVPEVRDAAAQALRTINRHAVSVSSAGNGRAAGVFELRWRAARRKSETASQKLSAPTGQARQRRPEEGDERDDGQDRPALDEQPPLRRPRDLPRDEGGPDRVADAQGARGGARWRRLRRPASADGREASRRAPAAASLDQDLGRVRRGRRGTSPPWPRPNPSSSIDHVELPVAHPARDVEVRRADAGPARRRPPRSWRAASGRSTRRRACRPPAAADSRRARSAACTAMSLPRRAPAGARPRRRAPPRRSACT